MGKKRYYIYENNTKRKNLKRAIWTRLVCKFPNNNNNNNNNKYYYYYYYYFYFYKVGKFSKNEKEPFGLASS